MGAEPAGGELEPAVIADAESDAVRPLPEAPKKVPPQILGM